MSDKHINSGDKDKYPWEIGTQLAAEVRARDLDAAMKSIAALVEVIGRQSSGHGLDEARLRVMQALAIANRAAYDAGANPDQLFHVNLDLITDLINSKDMDQISSLAQSTVKNFISLVPERNLVNDQKLDIAIAYIREHCTEDLSREMVADVVGCGSASLSRIFSKELGRTFKEVVLKHRMDRAKELLRESSKSVVEVAFEVGYSDPNYFIAVFRRVTGITPGQYRRKIPQS